MNKIISIFKTLDDDIKNSLSEVTSPLRLGLIVLSIIQSKTSSDYLNSDFISLCLENAGVCANPKSITKSFARAGDKISRKIENNVISYKIMTKGINEVSYFFLNERSHRVILINNSEPYTSSIKIGDLLQKLNGEMSSP